MEKRATVKMAQSFINGEMIKRSRLYNILNKDKELTTLRHEAIKYQLIMAKYNEASVSAEYLNARRKHLEYDDLIFKRLVKIISGLKNKYLTRLDSNTYATIIDHNVNYEYNLCAVE